MSWLCASLSFSRCYVCCPFFSSIAIVQCAYALLSHCCFTSFPVECSRHFNIQHSLIFYRFPLSMSLWSSSRFAGLRFSIFFQQLLHVCGAQGNRPIVSSAFLLFLSNLLILAHHEGQRCVFECIVFVCLFVCLSIVRLLLLKASSMCHCLLSIVSRTHFSFSLFSRWRTDSPYKIFSEFVASTSPDAGISPVENRFFASACACLLFCKLHVTF